MEHLTFLPGVLRELSESSRPLLSDHDGLLLLLLRVDGVSDILASADQLLEILRMYRS